VSGLPSPLARPRQRRRSPVGQIVAGAVLAGLVGTILFGTLSKSTEFFVTPTEYQSQPGEYRGRVLRLGGLVRAADYNPKTLDLTFTLTDYGASYPVTYRGAVSDLFKENQGVVVRGQFQGGVFHAQELLVKHSEEYRVPGNQADIKTMLRDTK
jgi:cytochrome c-type biogenesis protein CcmE